MLKLHENGKIKYNHLKLIAIQEYKILLNFYHELFYKDNIKVIPRNLEEL